MTVGTARLPKGVNEVGKAGRGEADSGRLPGGTLAT